MSAPLTPCPGCVRHVRASADACPFCGAALPVAPVIHPEDDPPTGEHDRPSRGAIMFGRAGRRAALGIAAIALVGCPTPVYGGPPDASPRLDAPGAVADADGGLDGDR